MVELVSRDCFKGKVRSFPNKVLNNLEVTVFSCNENWRRSFNLYIPVFVEDCSVIDIYTPLFDEMLRRFEISVNAGQNQGCAAFK